MSSKAAPMTVEAHAWADDAPAIAGPQVFQGDGDSFSLSVLDGAVRFELDRVRHDRGDSLGPCRQFVRFYGGDGCGVGVE